LVSGKKKKKKKKSMNMRLTFILLVLSLLAADCNSFLWQEKYRRDNVVRGVTAQFEVLFSWSGANLKENALYGLIVTDTANFRFTSTSVEQGASLIDSTTFDDENLSFVTAASGVSGDADALIEIRTEIELLTSSELEFAYGNFAVDDESSRDAIVSMRGPCNWFRLRPETGWLLRLGCERPVNVRAEFDATDGFGDSQQFIVQLSPVPASNATWAIDDPWPALRLVDTDAMRFEFDAQTLLLAARGDSLDGSPFALELVVTVYSDASHIGGSIQMPLNAGTLMRSPCSFARLHGTRISANGDLLFHGDTSWSLVATC
jgi:hypothetical protein